jgi:hypothetical protein
VRGWEGWVKHNIHIFEPVLPPPISSEFPPEADRQQRKSKIRIFLKVSSNFFQKTPQMKISKKFQRRIEDFVCGKCEMKTQGNGYTDHCPNCLWGKHVDVNPGDRSAKCGGMMEPVHVFKKKNDYKIEYICEKCGHKFRVKSAPEDKFGVLISLIKNSVIGN